MGKSELNQPSEPNRRHAALVNLVGGYVNLALVTISGVFLLPLYLHYIDHRLYGAWAGSGDIIAWLGILDLGFASLMIQRMSDAYGKQNDRLMAQYFATGILVLSALVVILNIVALILSQYIPGLMHISGSAASVLSISFVLSFIATGLGIINNGLVGFSFALQKTTVPNLLTIVCGVLRIFCTIWLLTLGKGLMAIALSYVLYNGSLLIGNVIYAYYLYRLKIKYPFCPNLGILKEFFMISPPMFFAKFGNAVMGKSSAAVVAIFLRPELATILVVTGKMADIIRMFLDRFGGATFAGFAHLVGSGQFTKARRVYEELVSIHTSISVLMTCVYIATNQWFVTVWVGPDQFGGQWLTFMLGLSVLASSRSSLLEYLYGATGQIVRTAYVILSESVLQIPFIFIFLFLMRLPGLPLANTLTSIGAALLVYIMTCRELSADPEEKTRINYLKWGVYITAFTVSAFLGNYKWSFDGLKPILFLSFISCITMSIIISDPYLFNQTKSFLKNAKGLIPNFQPHI